MDRLSLRTIVDGAIEIQRECEQHYCCSNCFFYTDKYEDTNCQLKAYMKNDVERIGKILSLQYLK